MSAKGASLIDALSKSRARIRARGFAEVLRLIADRLRTEIRSDDAILFLTRPALWEGDVPRKTEDPVRLEEATRDDSFDYERFIGTDSARTFARRLTNETRCWLVRGREMVLHASWTTTGAAWTREIKRMFVPPEGSAYIYESFTRPEARGLGTYPFALVEIGQALATEGVGTLFVGVEVDNAPSLRAISKAGFEPAFTVSFSRRFGRVTIETPSGPRAELAHACLRRA